MAGRGSRAISAIRACTGLSVLQSDQPPDSNPLVVSYTGNPSLTDSNTEGCQIVSTRAYSHHNSNRASPVLHTNLLSHRLPLPRSGLCVGLRAQH